MNGRNRFPFTPSQWQELEHQALIFKYMASVGWNYLQMGLGRKIDPEPGRCRRTDGKKWRCSKEAYPDSKYCERHMHRGKNRSRKPVEVLKTTTNSNTNASSTPAISSITKNTPTTTHSLSSETHHHPPQHSCYGSSFFYHHPTSRSSGIGLSFEDNSAPLFLDTGSCSQSNTDCRSRYVYGEKEEVDEHAFFTEPCGNMKSFTASSMDDSWQLRPLTMSSSSSSSKQRSCSSLSNDYSYLQLHSKQEQDQGCYMFGSGGDGDETLIKHGKEPQKTIHRFFDEWPHKGRGGSWLDLDDKSSTTQLSISIPTSSHDFPTFSSSSRSHHDG
ncbi:growth-regulating factor 1 isoform X2 [Abrus precatorius]|uniref:Growth-regulating factor n=1 Tax=Abrus precatorius TaxID=3816 RepID=A0A8B8K7U0_ABRPR|nr:growth-regulating factor 1 isoform X2 [Abrus precatorius]